MFVVYDIFYWANREYFKSLGGGGGGVIGRTFKKAQNWRKGALLPGGV